MFDPNHPSTLSVLLSSNFLDLSKLISEQWHFARTEEELRYNHIIVTWNFLQNSRAILTGNPNCTRHKWSWKVMENHFQCSVCTVIYIECMSLLLPVLMVESEMYINIFDIWCMLAGCRCREACVWFLWLYVDMRHRQLSADNLRHRRTVWCLSRSCKNRCCCQYFRLLRLAFIIIVYYARRQHHTITIVCMYV